jgi:hypothetical protein
MRVNRIIEIRKQEALCRERAVMDTNRRSLWTEKAEEWHQLALLEVASNFRETQFAA